MWKYMILIIIPVILIAYSCEVPAVLEEEEKEIKIKNLLLNPHANLGENYWTFYESGTSECGVDLMSSNIFYIQADNDDTCYIYQSVNLPAGSGGKYILLIGYSWLEDDIPGYITNHPYIWGEEFDDLDNTLQYYDGINTRHNGPERTWKTVHGIFQLDPAAVKISFYLWQASSALMPYNGTRSVFDDLGVYIFNTLAEAEVYRDAYITAHPEVYE